MFVFKAAVVGAGTMGGQIAQTIAASGIPVVLKDVKDELVQAGLDEARNVTQGQVNGLVEKGQADRGAGRGPGRGGRRAHPGRHDVRGLRRRRLRDRGRARADGDQAGGLRRARRRHARPRDPRLEHLVAVDHRDRRGDPSARQGRRLPLLLPRLGHAADRDRRGRRHLGRDRRRRGQLRAGDPQAADHVRRGARASSSTASSTPASRRSGASRRRRACRSRRIDEGVGAANVVPMGPYFLVNLLGSRHRGARRRAPARVLRRSLLRPRGDAAPRRRRQARAPRPAATASTRRRASRPSRATPSPTSTSSSSS